MRRNALALLGARLVSALTTLVLLMYLGHTQGGEALGVGGVGLALGVLLSAVADSGTASLMIREGARDPRMLGRLLVTMSIWRLSVIPVAAIVMWFAIAQTISTRPAAVFLLALGLVVQQFAELTRAVFIARQEMHVSSLHSAVENGIWLVVVLGSLAAGASLELAFAAGVAVFAVSTVVGFGLVVQSGTRPLVLPQRALVSTLARQLGPFAAFVIVGVAYSRVDTLLLGALLPTGALVAVGAYFSAVRLLAATEYVPEAVARASYPRLAMAYRVDRDAVVTELRPAAALLVILGMPVPLLAFVAGPWLMTALFGPDVAPHAWLVVPLAAAVPLRFLSHLFGMALTSTDAQGRRVFAVVIALALVLVIDLVLIPRIGIMGAVVGSVAASVCVFAVYAVPVIRYVGHMGLLSRAAPYLLATAGLAVAGVAVVPIIGPPATAFGVASAYTAIAFVLMRGEAATIAAARRSGAGT